ncbi:hypothetical protein MMC19_006504 [Ptychographa xylographoides]|nr:hypothetical protein [Ptychographa xylographoides]
MSMPAWLNDIPAASNNDNGAFNPSVDPSMAFMQTPTSSNFDFNQLQNPQLQQRMQNGLVRHESPAFQTPAYHTQSIVPSKRPRPGTEMYGASPRQTPGTLPSSRSQTPQQAPYLGFHGNVNGSQQMQAPTPYQHLQHGNSSNASPSPIMQDQHFNSQAIPQRMQTVSPSPFSPAAAHYGSQASPPHSDYGSRVDTPQNGGNSYVHGMPYGSGQVPHFTPSPGPSNPNGQGGVSAHYAQNGASIQQQQRMYDMRQQQLVRQLHVTNDAAQQRHQGGMMNPSPAQMANYQQAARMQQMQQAMLRPPNPEHWIQNVTRFMHQRSLPFNPNPVVGGRPIHPVQLWSVVMKFGGSKKATASGTWQTVAGTLQLHPVQFPTAAQELQNYWHVNLYPWEQTVLQQFQAQQRHRSVPPNQPGMAQAFQGDNATPTHDQFSPVKQLHSQNQVVPVTMHARRPSAAEFQTPGKPSTTSHNDTRQTHLNGYTQTQQVHPQNQQQTAFGMHHSGVAPQALSTPSRARQTSYSSTASVGMKNESFAGAVTNIEAGFNQTPITDPFLPGRQDLKDRNIKDDAKGTETHGGIQIASIDGLISELIEYRPNVPKVFELGVIDIRALIMSLKSGIHAEVRLSLDTLVSLSIENRSPSLEDCDDLVETLIDCAEEQVDFLAESAAEVSDVMLISPYEDVVRGCHCEMSSLLDLPEFGTLEYDLDRSVERLICITTILRNYSETKANHRLLAEPFVVRFMTTVIRYLGTRNMLLRTHRNTLDFSKDIVICLSNLSYAIKIPGKEEALCILHFLLSFAPSPPPTVPGIEDVMFSSYSPSVHRYLPPAVDSLAKILARDDPNRTFYKSIFSADSTSSPPYDLLTRTFALAVAPVPHHTRAHLAILEARKPFIAQGMLAAEILVTLIPSTEHSLARSWLMSGDGFATNLLRLVSLLSVERPPIPERHPTTRQVMDPDPQAYGMVTNRGISILRKLAEKAKDSDTLLGSVPFSVLPKRDSLIRVLTTENIDRTVVRQLCALAGLEN